MSKKKQRGIPWAFILVNVHTRLLKQDLAWLHHQLEDEKACIGGVGNADSTD